MAVNAREQHRTALWLQGRRHSHVIRALVSRAVAAAAAAARANDNDDELGLLLLLLVMCLAAAVLAMTARAHARPAHVFMRCIKCGAPPRKVNAAYARAPGRNVVAFRPHEKIMVRACGPADAESIITLLYIHTHTHGRARALCAVFLERSASRLARAATETSAPGE